MKTRLVRAEFFHADGQTDIGFFIILQTRLKMTVHPWKIWLNSNIWGKHQQICVTFAAELIICRYQSFHLLFYSRLLSET
jgi:hypothetical protein